MSNFCRRAALRARLRPDLGRRPPHGCAHKMIRTFRVKERAGNTSAASATDLVHRTRPWEDRHMLNTLARLLRLPASLALGLR